MTWIKCKIEKKQQFSGGTWVDVYPLETRDVELETYDTEEECEGFRWVIVPGEYRCVGVDKHYVEKEQTYINGYWIDTSPLITRIGGLYERNSFDCGFVPSGYTIQYITFFAKESGSFSFSGTLSNTVQYSLDSGSTWTTLASGTSTPTVQSGETIMWKASLTPGSNGSGRFSSTGQFEVEGNAMSLLFDDNFVGQTSLSGYSHAFSKLFSGCTGLTSAENLILPATTLSGSCYSEMFRGCTSLASAPELPATTLANNCYYFMFQGCTSLTSAPELPATTLADACYVQMFGGCSSLATAPQLPATNLTHLCYGSMFSGCLSLTSAPSILPATTLAQECYTHMFYNCSGLTAAPILPATTLAYGCYYQMFYGCRNLSSITCLAIDISATDCTKYWVYNVSSSGTFTKNASMSSWTTGINGIPSRWAVQDYSG